MATSKYSDIEIQTAKNLLKNGFKWLARNESGRLSAHAAKPIKVDTYWWSVGYSDCTCDYVPIFQNIRFGDKEPVSLESIVHPQILDDAEKRYLSAVIKPFRDKVTSITKCDASNFEFIRILLSNEKILLPFFKKGAMYNGMEPGRRYTLEELWL